MCKEEDEEAVVATFHVLGLITKTSWGYSHFNGFLGSPATSYKWLMTAKCKVSIQAVHNFAMIMSDPPQTAIRSYCLVIIVNLPMPEVGSLSVGLRCTVTPQ